jgi:hypothetical protein
MKHDMSKKTMRKLIVSCIEKYSYLILILVWAISLVVAWRIGFGRVDNVVVDKTELARLIAIITFPTSGILLFVLGQSLNLRDKYAGQSPIDRIVTAYTYMSVISAITIVVSAITGLLSFIYFKSAGDTLLMVALYFFWSTLILLIINSILFTIYTIIVRNTIKNMGAICNVSNDNIGHDKT